MIRASRPLPGSPCISLPFCLLDSVWYRCRGQRNSVQHHTGIYSISCSTKGGTNRRGGTAVHDRSNATACDKRRGLSDNRGRRLNVNAAPVLPLKGSVLGIILHDVC